MNFCTEFSRLAAVTATCAMVLLSPRVGWAFGSNEVQLCQDAADSLSISNYTDELQKHMTDRTGAVPAWLVAKAVKKAAKKNKTISGISGAAGELKDWCDIAAEDDEVVRSANALKKLLDAAGPVGAIISVQMDAGLAALDQGMQYISTSSTTRLNTTGDFDFCLKIYEPRIFWFDRLKDRSAVLAEVSGVYMFSQQNSLPTGPVPSAVSVNTYDANQRNLLCYKTTFAAADVAEAAYAIRVDFNNGQRLYAPVSSLKESNGESNKSLFMNALLQNPGAIFYTPR